MNSFDTPILFLVFNRPDPTRKVFETIRKIKPKQLFVAADGPRKDRPLDIEMCEEVKRIVTQVDWNCDLKILFQEENLGCGKAVSEAISWFFEKVDQGIILEDDCLPDISFFEFCSILLHRHKYDDQVMHIGGNNFQFGKNRGNGDYYYSILGHIWGWATWRRAWRHYEFDLATAKPVSEESFSRAFKQNDLFINYYKDVFLQVGDHKIDTWDYQWLYTIIRNNGLAICPEVNLVQNIGFGKDATHTLYETQWNQINTAKSLLSCKPPSIMTIAYEADAFFLTEIVGVKEDNPKINRPETIIALFKKKARRILNRLKLSKKQIK
jgi:hypothetical protein